MILITDREYAEIVMRLGQIMATHRYDNRTFNSARLTLNAISKAKRNTGRRIKNIKERI